MIWGIKSSSFLPVLHSSEFFSFHLTIWELIDAASMQTRWGGLMKRGARVRARTHTHTHIYIYILYKLASRLKILIKSIHIPRREILIKSKQKLSEILKKFQRHFAYRTLREATSLRRFIMCSRHCKNAIIKWPCIHILSCIWYLLFKELDTVIFSAWYASICEISMCAWGHKTIFNLDFLSGISIAFSYSLSFQLDAMSKIAEPCI
jgi:hypothetical protein